MSRRFEEIARRKQALIEKARLERIELSAACQRIRSPFDFGGIVFRIGHLLRTHPFATAGVSSFIISGFGRTLFRSARLLFNFRRVVLPIWAWWRNRRRPS